MDFNAIFTAYYNLYRAEAQTPATSDDEYPIALRLANEAIIRWANYDGVYWKELYTTLQSAVDGTKVISASTTYTAPTDMREAGGYVRVLDATGNTVQRIPIIEPQDAQFRNDMSSYAYFTGNPSQGFVLHLNPVPTSSMIGKSLDYVYYKKPTEFRELAEDPTGTDVTEMANPYMIVHRVLANRFRASRNPYYNSALRDSEDILKNMKIDNDSGNWADPWTIPDRSGSGFGV